MTSARCCGLDLSNLGAPEASRHLVPLEEQAAQACRDGAVEAAERSAIYVLELAPGRIAALSILYESASSRAICERRKPSYGGYRTLPRRVKSNRVLAGGGMDREDLSNVSVKF